MSEGNCSPPPTGRLISSQSQKRSRHGKQHLLPIHLLLTPSSSSTSFFIAECGIVQYGISPWSFQVRCSSSAPLPAFCPPPAYSLQGEQRQKKSSLDVEQAPCSSSQNTGVLPVLLQPQIQNTAPYGLLGRELTPSQPAEKDVCAVSFCKAVIAPIYRQ